MALTKVTNTGIADDAVTADKIEDGTVVAADIAPGTIANAKLANSSITVNGSSFSLGGSGTVKHIDWQALTVADGSTTLTTEAGKGYFLDTNAGVIEVFLPTSPSRGDTVVLADYSGTFGTNQIIINTGGELLDSTAGNDFKVTTNNSIVELIYVDSAKGWLVKLNQAAGTTPSSALEGYGGYDTVEPFIAATGGTITTSGDFKIHTFTGDGCFVVTATGIGTPTNPSTVDYLVVAGGGAGGGSLFGNGMSGGGGGGYRESKSGDSGCWSASPLVNPTGITVSATTYPITVGAGGSQGAPYGPIGSSPPGTSGSDSIFSTITSAGGGRGGDYLYCGIDGGSGSGGGDVGCQSGGSGNTPPVSPPQGNNGGNGSSHWCGGGTPNTAMGGAGGGAGGAGSPGAPRSGTLAGAPGTPTSFTGTSVSYSAGGRAKALPNSPTSEVGPAGSANTGNAGGGAAIGGGGGKGIVVLRYKFQ